MAYDDDSGKVRKEILFRMQDRDVEIIESIRRRFGGTTTAAIRTCIRMADEVQMQFVRVHRSDED